MAKHLAHISSPRATIPDLSYHGATASCDRSKADILARFFASQCSTPDLDEGTTLGAPFPLPKDHPTFSFPQVTDTAVLHGLQHLPGHKASGGDGLTNRILQEVAPIIAPSLAHIFNLSVNSCVFPTNWKHATVCPLYKNKGDAADPSNYRPVSLLPAIGKLLDKLQSAALLKYLTSRHFISSHQFGFLPGKSTTKQLVYITDLWLRSIDKGRSTMAVFMDFHKAFDRVWHSGLLHKLGKLGLSPAALSWLQDYLTGRTLSVKVGSHVSDVQRISAGVPQGSHLGPVLFLVFVNDLPPVVASPTELYADDALLHEQVDNVQQLQTSIDCTTAWASSWHGRFGPAKTEAMVIANAPARAATTRTHITIEGQNINIVDHHKHLGVILSNDLKWSSHMSQVIANCRRKAGLLQYMSRFLEPSTISHLYLSYVRPSLEYACQLWDPSLTSEEVLTLERLQASVARRVLRADWFTPKETLFRTLQWPALRWRRTVLSVALLHDLLISGIKAEPLRSCLFASANTVSTYDLRKPRQLVLPAAKTARYKNSFFFHSALLWNSLPGHIQRIDNRKRFKSEVENYWSDYKFKPDTPIPL